MNRQLSDHELVGVLVTGLMRSIAMLEDFILHAVDPTKLEGKDDSQFLNRVKERNNTGKNPIEIYLRPDGAE